MPGEEARGSAISLLLLRSIRGLVADPMYRAFAGGSAALYVVLAMIVGGMLEVSSTGGGRASFLWIVPRGPGGGWSYPAILVGGPHFLLFLPILSTVLMIGTAVGVGLGMSAALRVGVGVIRSREARAAGTGAPATVAGLTPVLLGLLTLGACCSTTLAAGAGIAAVAELSGTSTTAVLVNTWYLGLFQIVAVYVALLAQERLVIVYELFYPPAPSPPFHRNRVDRTAVARSALRTIAIASGLVWAVSSLTYWFASPLGYTSGSTWAGVLVQHVVPGAFAVLIGVLPNELVRLVTAPSRVWVRRGVRGLAGVSGAMVLFWLPPSFLARGGSGALFNEIVGALGGSAGWGAVVPPSSNPIAIVVRWALGFVLVGGTSLAFALRPDLVQRVYGGGRASLPTRLPPTPASAANERTEPA